MEAVRGGALGERCNVVDGRPSLALKAQVRDYQPRHLVKMRQVSRGRTVSGLSAVHGRSLSRATLELRAQRNAGR